MSHPLSPLAHALATRGVRYLVIGVSGANLYGPDGQAILATDDFDLFVPPDPDNLLQVWTACEHLGFDIWSGDEPLERPRDRWLAERTVEGRALTRVSGPDELQVDLTLVMAGFDFETAWSARRVFSVDGVPVATARLLHIVESKAAAGRPKDQLFLATHRDALEQLFGKGESR